MKKERACRAGVVTNRQSVNGPPQDKAVKATPLTDLSLEITISEISVYSRVKATITST